MNLNPVARRRKRCSKTRQLLSGFLDGELDRRRHRAVAGHLRWCPECGRMSQNLSRTIDALRLLGEDGTPADLEVPRT